MSYKAKEIREKRANLVHQMREIVDAADNEGRELTQEEEGKWSQLDSDQEKLKKQADLVEKQDRLNAERTEKLYEMKDAGIKEPETEEEKKSQERKAFLNFCKYGFGGLNEQERQIMAKNRTNIGREERAQSTTDAAGGYTIPEGFSYEIEQALKAYGGMREASRILSTASGNDLPWPTNDDTANKGRLLAEAGDSSSGATDLTFGQKVLNAYKYTSDLILVNRELAQDSAFDMGAFLTEALSTRIGRITNEHFTVGTGSAQPNGVVTASAKGDDAAAASAVSYDDLVNLMHSVDPAYRTQGARWMFNDSTLAAIKKLKDGNSLPLWNMGDIRAGAPDTILGAPYTINQDMADLGTSTRSVLYGAFNRYIIRDVLGITLLRLEERYAEAFQIAFVAFSRHDGELINENAVKHLLNPAA